MKIGAKSILKLLAFLAISVACVLIVSQYVPFDMDEFACYQGLNSYLYPLNQLNTFRESFVQYHLAPFGDFYLPLRSNLYIGTFPGILYFPLFKLWPSPESARLMGLIMLAVQAFLLGKLFKADILLSFLALLFFMPYAFQHIVDTGPVSFQTTSVFLLAYLARQWSAALNKNDKSSWKYPCVMGLVIGVCLWTKLAYLFILPPAFILILYSLVSNRTSPALRPGGRAIARDMLIGFSAAVIPSFLLLNSNQRWDAKYYTVVTGFALAKKPDLTASLEHVGQIAKYFTDPLLAAHRVFDIEDKTTALGILYWMPVIALLFFGMKFIIAKKEKIGFIVLNMSLFILTLFLLGLNPSAWAMHHVVLSFPFLILALAEIGSKLSAKRTVLALAALFLILNLTAYSQLPRQKPVFYNHPSKIKINNLLNERFRGQYVFIVIEFGMYYIKALYGNKTQCVLYIEPLNKPEQINGVREVLTRLDRKAVFISFENSASDLELIRKEFPRLVQLKTNFETGNWKIWYEE